MILSKDEEVLMDNGWVIEAQSPRAQGGQLVVVVVLQEKETASAPVSLLHYVSEDISRKRYLLNLRTRCVRGARPLSKEPGREERDPAPM